MSTRKNNRFNSDRVLQHKQSKALLLSTFGVLFALALVSWSVAELYDPETLPVKKVQVNGEFVQVSDKQLQTVVMANELGGFFSTNVDAITDTVLAMPWVERVATRRVWPDELHITVFEQQAVAVWNKTALLSKEGELFFPNKGSFPQGLPKLMGPEGMAKQVLSQYQTMQSQLKIAELSILQVELDARRAWTLLLTNNIRLILGRNNSEQKISRFVSVYPKLIAGQQEKIEQIDLRYTNGIAVHWQQAENKNTAELPVGMRRYVQKS